MLQHWSGAVMCAAGVAACHNALRGHFAEFSRCPLPPKADIDRKLLNVGSSIGRTDASVFVEPADMVLGVKLKTKLSDEVELGLQKVNMTFLIVHQLFEQVARHIIPG